jgi:hypothetical protein
MSYIKFPVNMTRIVESHGRPTIHTGRDSEESVPYELDSTLESRRILDLSFVDDDNVLMDGTSHGLKSPELVLLRTTPSADITGNDTDQEDARTLFSGLQHQMRPVITVVDYA